MKPSRFLVTLALSILLFSCNDGQKEIQQLRSENDRLVSSQQQKDSLMLTIVQTFVAMDSNMRSIKNKEELIQQYASSSSSKKSRSTIVQFMNEIDSLTEANKNLVVKIERRFADKNIAVIGAQEMIDNLNEKNDLKKENVSELKGKLATIHQDFRALFEEYVVTEATKMELDENNEALKANNSELLDKLNSVWYLLGTKTELKEKGLTDRKGLLDSQRLNSKLDRQHFKKADLRKFLVLPLNVKRASIITPHPEESYQLIGDRKFTEKLIITNPELFWSVSKYLLIEIESE
jgi:hypothetical protein